MSDGSRSQRLIIELDAERVQALRALSELYHATPERMAASWVEYHIDRLQAGQTPDSVPSRWRADPGAGNDRSTQV
ncbi:hypothetical protein [Mycolicibacterium sp. NCC-Tsukiji]|uniref:hypothetical protein n=1 Tax=Mycolicibacterium sp. NCC-Tsukiji TaxID=2185272 RepID=UPI000EE275A2|nr:hypothetical protein [Mycolicibacterium sp. NCC-Tsukiji]GCB01179.1 hypothetical protein NCCNTM_48130 [Mycolicibacterium sp. NCC-Tsukiji]